MPPRLAFGCLVLTEPYSNSRLFTFVLTDGGTADLFWGFMIVGAGQTLVYASIAEAASMQVTPSPGVRIRVLTSLFRSPTAGGQYHWVSEFAPPKIQKMLSYLVGACCPGYVISVS
jgi:choline transport protein